MDCCSIHLSWGFGESGGLANVSWPCWWEYGGHLSTHLANKQADDHPGIFPWVHTLRLGHIHCVAWLCSGFGGCSDIHEKTS